MTFRWRYREVYMNAIVSVTKDWGIGLEGNLLVRNPADMRFFKEHTMGGTVICGQTTFESFPGGALEGRRNVVLSLDPAFEATDAEVYRTLEDALEAVANEDPKTVWVIGGASIYLQLLPHCTKAIITKNDVTLSADTFFPNLDEDPSWHVESVDPGGTTESGIPYVFITYVRSEQ
jgi:dihydrofolate reductase